MANTSIGMKLCDLPLWRLIVALDDAERVADSPTARALAQEIKLRLASKAVTEEAKAVPRG